MRKIKKKLTSIIPQYSLFPLILAVAVNMIVYVGARIVARGWYHYNLETRFDRMIPFWSPAVAIYLGCYIYWIVNYILIARQGEKEVCQFFVGDFLGRLVCLAFFLLFPTTNFRPEITPSGFWDQIMLFVYRMDAPDNLFPSIHCLVSWYCYIGIRGKKNIPVWYQWASLLLSVLVFISTLMTKQHVIVDVISGILLAEITFVIGKKTSVWKIYERFIDNINEKIHCTIGVAECRQKRKQY